MLKSLSSKILVLVIGILMITFIALTANNYINHRNSLKEIMIRESLDKSRLYAENIGLTINNLSTPLSLLAEDEETRQWQTDYIVSHLESIMKRYPDMIINAYYIEMNGDTTDILGRSSNISDRYFYELLINSEEEIILTRVMYGRLVQAPVFSIGAIVRDESNQPIGAIGISVNVEMFSESIQHFKLAGDSYPWITDDFGTVAVHPIEGYPYYVSLQDAGEIGYEGFEEITGNILAQREGYGEYYDHNIEEYKLVTYTPIPYTGGWSLNITTLQRDIYRDTDRIIGENVLISLIIIGLTAVLIYRFIKKIIMPIEILSRAVEESVTGGIVKINQTSSTSEISRLITGYNEMAEKVTVYTDNLQDIVEERTQELDIVNQQLSSQNELLASTVEKLNIQASTDELTGLKNRLALYRYMELMFKWLEGRRIDTFSVIFIDLDSFKYFNDTFGHDIGDKILRDFSRVLEKSLRKGDYVARYGGDEFVIVLDDIEEDDLELVRKKLYKGIEAYNNELEGYLNSIIDEHREINLEKYLGLSTGVCTVDSTSSLDIDEVIKKADEMMYSDKYRRKGGSPSLF